MARTIEDAYESLAVLCGDLEGFTPEQIQELGRVIERHTRYNENDPTQLEITMKLMVSAHIHSKRG